MYLFLFIVVGIILIGRAAYVALQIKKPEKADKYGANSKTGILVLAIIGAVCFVIGGIGFAVKNKAAPNKNSGIETDAPLKTIAHFGNDYNQYAEKLGREIIDDWSFTDENSNSKVMSIIFNNTGATMSIYTLPESPQFVIGATYLMESSDDQLKTIQNLSRLYVLIETFESGEPDGNVVDFVQSIITNAANQIILSENNISYSWQEINGGMMIYIDTISQ